MTLTIGGEHIADVNVALHTMSQTVANWTAEERQEALVTIGELAILAGTRGHEMHRRVAEVFVQLRDLIRSVDSAVESALDEMEANHGRS